MELASLSKESYAKQTHWHDFFFTINKTYSCILYDVSWSKLFAQLQQQGDEICDKLKELSKDATLKIYPFPTYVLSAFMLTPADELSVVILGQDPYFNCEYTKDGAYVPQAMGMSFSVPDGVTFPSSLEYIYSNLLKFGHMKTKPRTGNLWTWGVQGCLLLNTALTVIDGAKKSHSELWKKYTNFIVSYLSTNFNNLVFMLWGGDAYSYYDIIDKRKHSILISSHPSGLSANKPFRTYPPFMEVDHFGMANDILERNGKTKIMWDLI
jgi:uracil-DNA glycosylase